MLGKQVLRFEDVEVDLARNCVTQNGREIHLRQKAFQVLVHLIQSRERLVTKNELFEVVWENAAVTDDVLVQCITEIRRSIGDDSHHPRFIKTIHKSGYRFIGDVAPDIDGSYTEEITKVEIELEEDDEPVAESITPASRQLAGKPTGWINRYSIAGVAAIVLLAAAAFSYLVPKSQTQIAQALLPQIDGRKTIAVMYFDNQSKSVELDWLREGLADMLITNLSGSDKLTVLSRQQLQLWLDRVGYRIGAEVSLENALDVGRLSGAEMIVLGSFSQLGEKMRLDVRLHDAKSGGLLAAESLTVERPDEIFTDIDLLSFRLASRLGAEGQEDQANIASAMTNNIEAYRYYSQALEKAQGLHSKDALDLLGKAIALDPEFAMAHARIGHTYAVTLGHAAKAKPHLARAFELSGRLTEKDRLYILAWYSIAELDYPEAIRSFREIIARYPAETEAYVRLGSLLRGEEDFEESIAVFRRGLMIDPDSPTLYNALGHVYSLRGMHGDAIAMHQRYIALAPSEPNAHDSLGMSFQWAGRYDEAIAQFDKALELDPDFEIALVHLGITFFQTGRYAKAVEMFEKYIASAHSQLDVGRGRAHIAHVYRKQKKSAAVRIARQAFRENEYYVWERIASTLDEGDLVTAKGLEDRLFSQTTYSNRGMRANRRQGFFYRGYIAFKSGQTGDALEHFRQALRHAPATWDIDSFEDCLAHAYLELGRFDEAIAEYERVLQLNPNYPLAQFHLGRAYEAKGRTQDARTAYRTFLASWKDADADIAEVIAARKFVE